MTVVTNATWTHKHLKDKGANRGKNKNDSQTRAQSNPSLPMASNSSSSTTTVRPPDSLNQSLRTGFKLPEVVTSRMMLDAKTMSPAMLALRANPRNMVNEARLGLPLSTNYGIWRPRPKVQWEKLPVLQKPKGYKRALRKQQERLGQGVWVSEYSQSTVQLTKQSTLPTFQKQFFSKVPEDSIAVAQERAEFQKQFSAQPSIKEEPKIELPEVTDPKVQQVFEQLQDDSAKVLRAHFKRALELLGFTRPDPMLCDDAVQSLWPKYKIKQGQYWTLPQFGVAVSAFEQRWKDWVKKQFEENDIDNSGSITTAELRSLCKSLEFFLLPEAVEILQKEADVDGNGSLDFEEFLEALRLLRERHGFTRDEVTHYLSVFTKYDKDKSGEICACELDLILSMLGYPSTEAQCNDLIDKVDLDSSGHLNQNEFLMVMRIYREAELQEVEQMFSSSDINYSGTLDAEEMRGLLQKLGYTMSTAVLREVAQEVKFAHMNKTSLKRGSLMLCDVPLEDQVQAFRKSRPEIREFALEFIFEDFWKILKLFRLREGFLLEEISDFFQAFEHHDGNGSGEIEPFEFTRILNWLGFPSTPARRQTFWQKVDADGTNCLEKDEFLKLMRLYYEDEASHIRRHFEAQHADVRLHVPADFNQMYHLVTGMEYCPPRERLEAAIQAGVAVGSGGNTNITFDGLLEMCHFLRERRAEIFRQNAGLSDGEVVKIKKMFSRLDKDGSGDLELVELQKFLKEICPQLKHSKQERERMDRIVEKADDGSGGLTLLETLWVVRNYRDELEEEKWHKEQATIASAGFTQKEVAEFRSVFISADLDGSGFLSECEVMMVIEQVLLSNGFAKIDKATRNMLHDKIDELDQDGDRQTSFPEFLLLMQVAYHIPEASPDGAKVLGSKTGADIKASEASKKDGSTKKLQTSKAQTLQASEEPEASDVQPKAKKGVRISEKHETVTYPELADEEEKSRCNSEEAEIAKISEVTIQAAPETVTLGELTLQAAEELLNADTEVKSPEKQELLNADETEIKSPEKQELPNANEMEIASPEKQELLNADEMEIKLPEKQDTE